MQVTVYTQKQRMLSLPSTAWNDLLLIILDATALKNLTFQSICDNTEPLNLKITSILDPRKRKRAFNRAIKRTKWAFTRPRSSIPVFVFGKQRSGTTMFMDILENREDTEVYQEWDKSVYLDSRIRSLDAVAEAIEKSRAPFVCFKPICDSHLIGDFVSRFPEGKYIWIIRNYLDSANSEIRRFPDSEHAVRLTCEGKPGGGWIQESMSAKALKRLQEI